MRKEKREYITYFYNMYMSDHLYTQQNSSYTGLTI